MKKETKDKKAPTHGVYVVQGDGDNARWIKIGAADIYEARIEDVILRGNDLYDLDGETALRRRDGRVETGSFETFDMEAF